MPDLTIRPFQKSDSAVVARLMCRLATFHGDKSKASPAFIVRYALGAHKVFQITVATIKGKVVAFSAMTKGVHLPFAMKTTRIEYMFVDEAYRRQGIARRLIKESMRIALKSDVEYFSITANPHNKLSNKTYDRLGLKKTKNDQIRYVADTQTMKRLIAGKTPKEKN